VERPSVREAAEAAAQRVQAASRTGSARPEPARKRGLMIGGGIALAAACIVAWLFLRGGDAPPSAEAPAGQAAPADTAPAAPAAPPAEERAPQGAEDG
jgi:hypothetical protein